MNNDNPDSVEEMKKKTPQRRWFEIVRARMSDIGMSYADLSNRLTERGIETAKSTVGAWMIGRNEPPLTTIVMIGEIVGMGISEIAGEDVYFVRDPLTRLIVERLDSMNEEEKKAVLKLLGIGQERPDKTP